jgi:hypothetical protein
MEVRYLRREHARPRALQGRPCRVRGVGFVRCGRIVFGLGSNALSIGSAPEWRAATRREDSDLRGRPSSRGRRRAPIRPLGCPGVQLRQWKTDCAREMKLLVVLSRRDLDDLRAACAEFVELGDVDGRDGHVFVWATGNARGSSSSPSVTRSVTGRCGTRVRCTGARRGGGVRGVRVGAAWHL